MTSVSQDDDDTHVVTVVIDHNVVLEDGTETVVTSVEFVNENATDSEGDDDG